MRNIFAGVVFVMCFFTMVGWGSTYKVSNDSDKGNDHADRERQSDDEDIKRTQGEESARISVHEQGALQNDDKV